MAVKQLSVFVENKPGSLAKISKALGDEKINIRALSVGEVGEFGIIRLIVDNPEKARDALKKRGYSVGLTDVLAVEMGDEPGSLAKVTSILGENNINIEYAYAFITRESNKAALIARVNDLEKAEKILTEKGFNFIQADELYHM